MCSKTIEAKISLPFLFKVSNSNNVAKLKQRSLSSSNFQLQRIVFKGSRYLKTFDLSEAPETSIFLSHSPRLRRIYYDVAPSFGNYFLVLAASNFLFFINFSLIVNKWKKIRFMQRGYRTIWEKTKRVGYYRGGREQKFRKRKENSRVTNVKRITRAEYLIKPSFLDIKLVERDFSTRIILGYYKFLASIFFLRFLGRNRYIKKAKIRWNIKIKATYCNISTAVYKFGYRLKTRQQRWAQLPMLLLVCNETKAWGKLMRKLLLTL